MKRMFSVLVLVVMVLMATIAGSFMSPQSTYAAPPDPPKNPWVAEQVAAWEDCVDVALGKLPADIAVRAGKLFDSNSRTWLDDQIIAMKGNYICWTGPAADWKHEAKEFVDYSAYTLGPVFGEVHTHLASSRETCDQAARFQPLYGQGWMVNDTHEESNVYEIFKAVGLSLKCWGVGSPFNIYPNLSTASPPTPFEDTGAGFSYNYANFVKLFQGDPRVVTDGETMNGPVWKGRDFPGHDALIGLIMAAFATGNPIQGHMSMYTSYDDISAGTSMHLYSDHENARGTDEVNLGEEAYRKLTHGVALILRPADAEKILPYLLEKGVDPSKVMITTDDRAPDETLEIGGSRENILRVIAVGVPLETAWQMGSINGARYAHLDELEGSVSPGKFASFLVLEGNPIELNLKAVWVNGIHAVEDGQFIADIPTIDWSEYENTMDTGPLTTDNFVVKANGDKATVAVLSPFYFAPDYQTATLPVVNGAVQSDPANGYVKFSIVDRYHGTPNVANMFWTGVGPNESNAAFCETESHDSHVAQCLSTSDEAALYAINRLSEVGGGYIFVKDSAVVAEVPLEVGGLMTAVPAQQTATNFQNFWNKLGEYKWLGNLTAEKRQRFATLTCDPWKWVLVAPFEDCPSGFVNVTTGECRPVVLVQ